MTGPAPKNMPAAYLPLREGDLVRLDGRDAVVADPAPAGCDGQVIVEVMAAADDLTWVTRYRQ